MITCDMNRLLQVILNFLIAASQLQNCKVAVSAAVQRNAQDLADVLIVHIRILPQHCLPRLEKD